MGVNIITCDSENADILYDQLGTDICRISVVKWEATLVAAVLLIGIIIYMLKKWKFRCHKTLLTFHNLRAAVALLLLAINTIELARALLPQTRQMSDPAAVTGASSSSGSYGGVTGNNNNSDKGNGSQSNLPLVVSVEDDIDQIVIVIGMSELANALTALLMTITLMWYHRVVEIKKSLEFLYVSSTLSVLIFILRIYELAEIVYYDSFMELESIVQVSSGVCLLLLAFIDGFTVYKERYRPDYLEDYEKIGYKHTLATLYSKACFWWLTPLLWFGYKEPLELEDLGQMRIEDSARAHYDRFLLIYKTAKVKNSDVPPSLWLCYLKSSWRMFALGGLLKLFGDLFAVIGPLAIQQIVQYIEHMYGMHYNGRGKMTEVEVAGERVGSGNALRLMSVDNASGGLGNGNSGNNHGNNITDSNDYELYTSTDPLTAGAEVKINYASWLDLVSNGWCVAWLVLLAALAQGGLSQASTHILNMTGIHIKTSLQGLIYRKTLLLNATCIADDDDREQRQGAKATDDSSFAIQPSLGANGKVIASSSSSSSLPSGEGNKCNNGVTTNCSNNVSTQDHNDNPQQEDAMRKDKGSDLKDTSDKNATENNALNDVGAITNLMSEDTLNIMSFFWIAHYVWAIPLKIAIVMYLLYLKLGISAVIGSFVCILTMTPLQFLIGKSMSRNAEVMAKFTDKRLKKLHDCFVGIKLIKLNAWDNVFIKKIDEARRQELKYLNKDSVYWTLMTILTHICSVLITFVTLAVYVYRETGEDFTASRLFSALALFQQLTVPLLIFPITVPIILSAIVSTRRLERFLSASEIQKQFEGIRHMARILSKSDASLDMYECKSQSLPANITLKTGNDPGKSSNEKQNIKIFIPEKPAPLANSEPHTPLLLQETKEQLDFPFDHKKLSSHARKELLRNTPYVVIRPRKALGSISSQPPAKDHSSPQHPLHNHHYANHQMQHRHSKTDSWHRDSLLLKMPDDIAVSVKDCKFSWHPQRVTNILYIRDIVIPRGKLTMIVGKNGSGKSSLLSALLMEMPLISGDMIWNKTSTIAYVPQQPWLLNASIRENILFGESFRPKRYDFVLNACALKPDIDLMPAGDLTVIGERGINLSGGQKQRVTIARALYSSANVVIMDDPLSSLDNEVARHIFEQSIRKMLLKANRTVILVTQQLNLVQQAHNLIVLKDGYLQASGSYKDIAATHPYIIAKWNSIIAKADEKEHQQSLNESTALGRTARERWKLFKNVAKLGLQRSPPPTPSAAAAGTGTETATATANPMDAIDAAKEGSTATTLMENILPADEEEEYDMMPASSSLASGSSFKLSRTPSAMYGPRHLIYDVPLPLDECQSDNVIMRRRRRTSSRSDSALRCPRPGSRTSNVSNTPTELRRSLLTNSCGSAVSYMTNLSTTSGEDSRTQSLQMTAAAAGNKGQQSLSSAVEEKEIECHHDEVDGVEIEKSNSGGGGSGFHQFLRRMSMRNSNKTKGGGVVVSVAQHRKARPGSGDTAILSISEESSGNVASSSIPSIELSSVAKETETETESWIAGIENEESIQDASNIDYKTLLANNDTSPQMTTQMDGSDRASPVAMPTKGMANDARTPHGARPMMTTAKPTTTTRTRMSYDVERKYGKIPAEIYLLYLRASGFTIVLIFFITALIWQTLRVYTDVWLQQWTDDKSGSNINGNINKPYNYNYNHTDHSSYHNVAGAAAVAAIQTITSANISAALLQAFAAAAPATPSTYMQQMSRRNYATTTATTVATILGPATAAEMLQDQMSFVVVADADGGDVVADGAGVAGQHHEVTYYFHMYAVISCICIIMAMISTPAGQWAGCKARQNLHDKLLQSIMHKSLHFFQVTPLGRIMNRFSNDMAIIDKKIAATSQRLLQFTLLCLCAILINVIITPWFMVVTVPVCLAYYAIQKFYRCSSRELQRIENSTNSPVISHLSETIQGVTTIRAYNQESRFTEILFRRLEENTIAFTILNTSNRWLGISLDYLGGVIVFVAIVTALLAATIASSSMAKERQQGISRLSAGRYNATSTMPMEYVELSPSPSLVGLAINYTLLMPIYLNWVVKLLADMEMYVGSVERIAYYAENDDDKMPRKDIISLQTTTTATNAHNVKSNSNSHNNNNNNNSSGSSKEPEVCVSSCIVQDEPTPSLPQDVVELKSSGRTSAVKVCNNDKLLAFSEISDAAPTSVSLPSPSPSSSTAAPAVPTAATGKSVDVAVAATTTELAAPLLAADGSMSAMPNKQTDIVKLKTNTEADNDDVEADDDDDDTHPPQPSTNDGHIAVTTKTFAHKQTSDDTQTTPVVAKPSTGTLPLLSLSKRRNTPLHDNSNFHCVEQRNDAERRASVRRRDRPCNNKKYKPVAISWPQRGDISFENVSLRYEGQHEDVIKNFNLHIPAGQRIGICGRTGSGKSSLALSLFGVLQISEGHIYIDDMDISHIHPDEVRTRLSIIPQDVHLFSMTIRENLDPSGYYSDFELWNCLELAQLKDFVNTKLPQGLDTEIVDGGLNLSVGHRQLFCLARAILRGSVCLVLDEATSALDSTTEKALLSAAYKAFQGRTIITIAHRLSTIMDYDRVIVLEKGKIIEDGDPHELKDKPDGIFAAYLKSGRPLSTISNDIVV